jgi:ABC-type polysaccharide/polyol phosphate export permease
VTIYWDLYRHRELFANLFRRELSAKYKGSVLGVAWSLANPLALMAIYVLVFSFLWRTVGGIPDYPLYLLCGLAVWIFFSTSLQVGARSLLDNADLIKKVRFPRQLVPLSLVATQLVSFAVMVPALMIADGIVIPETRDTLWLAPVIAALIVVLVSGVALVVASLNVLFRDIEHLLHALLLPWFFLTPIVYSYALDTFQRHHTAVQVLRYGNFVTPPIEALRAPLYEGRLPRLGDVVYLVVAAAVALGLGALVFNRVDDRIPVEL